MTPETCPNCGADVPPRAKACPECGACEETGWSDQPDTADLGIPEENFDYGEYVKREFGAKRFLPHGMSWFWWSASLIVVAALLWLWFR